MENLTRYTDGFDYKADLYHSLKYTLTHLNKIISWSELDKDNKDIRWFLNICFEKIKKELENKNAYECLA